MGLRQHTSLLLLPLLTAGCLMIGDGVARLRGRIVGPEASSAGCLLDLHRAGDEARIHQVRVTGAFEQTFVIAPRVREYTVRITCEGIPGEYRSDTLRLGGLEAYREGVDLGEIVLRQPVADAGDSAAALRDVVVRYVETHKQWDESEYSVEPVREEGTTAVFDVVHRDDLIEPVPGGGKSFRVHVDARAREVVRQLAFQ